MTSMTTSVSHSDMRLSPIEMAKLSSVSISPPAVWLFAETASFNPSAPLTASATGSGGAGADTGSVAGACGGSVGVCGFISFPWP